MNRHEELWQNLQILQKKPRWILGKENVNEKLLALDKISELGFPNTIANLMPFLKAKHSKIREKTCNTIVEYFKKLSIKGNLYDTLKHCQIDIADLESTFSLFPEKEKNVLLSIATLNSSGFVRERAVELLAKANDGALIPFLIYRLSDWVKPVRVAADKALRKYLSKEYLPYWVENLPLLDWLQKVERVNLNEIRTAVLDYILKENRHVVLPQYYTFKDKNRLILAKNIINEASNEEIDLFLKDNHFLVRNLVFDKFEMLSDNQIEHLLSDKSPMIRLKTLYKLQRNNADIVNFAERFLADNSASIREFSRFILKTRISDFASWYFNNFSNRQQVVGNILGLAETNGKNYTQEIFDLWEEGNIKVKKAILHALTKLDGELAFNIALSNFDSNVLSLRKISLNIIGKRADKETINRIRQAYEIGDIEMRKSILKMFNNIGGWIGLADFMLGTIDESKEIRVLSCEYLKWWQQKATRLFTRPNIDDLERSKEIFKLTFEIHEKRKFFDENPLKNLDFYLN
jgi:HEAT repeat protein